MDPDQLVVLVCPESRQPLRPAEPELLEKLNRAVTAGEIKNLSGHTLERPMEGGVVREDGRRLYPLIDGIPVLLADEAIALEE